MARLKLNFARKYWCCLYTYLTTRAVPTEVVEGLDTDACMMALTRFMARRGKPHTIVSVNGTSLVGAACEEREVAIQWNQTQIHDGPAQHKIAWKFNPWSFPFWRRLGTPCSKLLESDVFYIGRKISYFTRPDNGCVLSRTDTERRCDGSVSRR